MNLIHKVLKYGAGKVFPKEEVSQQEAEVRYKICTTGCNEYQPNTDQCGVCSCYMEVKSKTKIHWNPVKMRSEVTHCPLGKWDDVDIANHYREVDGKPKLETQNDV